MLPVGKLRNNGFGRAVEHGAQIKPLHWRPRVLGARPRHLAQARSQQRDLVHLAFDEFLHALLYQLVLAPYAQYGYRILN